MPLHSCPLLPKAASHSGVGVHCFGCWVQHSSLCSTPLISCQAVSRCLPLKQHKSDGTRAEAILLLISHSSSCKIWIVSAFLSQLATGTLLASTFEGSARAISAKAVFSQGWDILVLWFFVCLCILRSYSLLLALWWVVKLSGGFSGSANDIMICSLKILCLAMDAAHVF